MIRHAQSHVDHVPPQVLEHILERFSHKDEFFIETFELPAHLPEIESIMHGPRAGDPPVAESEVHYAKRPGRDWESRLVNRPPRLTRECTVIAGRYDDLPCVLFTVYGGPASPRELNDPGLQGTEERQKAEAFWAEHALSAPPQS